MSDAQLDRFQSLATTSGIGGINDSSAYQKSRSSFTHALVAKPAANKKV